jgi:hypothetical protein
MNDLKKALQPARDIADELRRLEVRELEDTKTLKTAGETGDIDDPKTQRRVADARTRLDMIKSRRRRLEPCLVEQEQLLLKAVQEEAGRWNRCVEAERERLIEARIQANLVFFEGDERACRKYYEGERMFEAPVFYEINRAFYPAGAPTGDPVQAAETLAAFIRRHAKLLGWTEEQAARTPAPRVAAAAKRVPAPARVQVRVLREFLLGDFKIISGQTKDIMNGVWITGRKILPGAVVEMSPVQYQALSASVEVLVPDSAAGDK